MPELMIMLSVAAGWVMVKLFLRFVGQEKEKRETEIALGYRHHQQEGHLVPGSKRLQGGEPL